MTRQFGRGLLVGALMQGRNRKGETKDDPTAWLAGRGGANLNA